MGELGTGTGGVSLPTPVATRDLFAQIEGGSELLTCAIKKVRQPYAQARREGAPVLGRAGSPGCALMPRPAGPPPAVPCQHRALRIREPPKPVRVRAVRRGVCHSRQRRLRPGEPLHLRWHVHAGRQARGRCACMHHNLCLAPERLQCSVLALKAAVLPGSACSPCLLAFSRRRHTGPTAQVRCSGGWGLDAPHGCSWRRGRAAALLRGPAPPHMYMCPLLILRVPPPPQSPPCCPPIPAPLGAWACLCSRSRAPAGCSGSSRAAPPGGATPHITSCT